MTNFESNLSVSKFETLSPSRSLPWLIIKNTENVWQRLKISKNTRNKPKKGPLFDYCTKIVHLDALCIFERFGFFSVCSAIWHRAYLSIFLADFSWSKFCLVIIWLPHAREATKSTKFVPLIDANFGRQYLPSTHLAASVESQVWCQIVLIAADRCWQNF